MARIGQRKTGTYYVQYRLPTKRKKLGASRYSRNFKKKSQVQKFIGMIRKKGGTFNVYFTESIIHDKVIDM